MKKILVHSLQADTPATESSFMNERNISAACKGVCVLAVVTRRPA